MGYGTDSGRIGRRLVDSKHNRLYLYMGFIVAFFFVFLNGFLSNKYRSTIFNVGGFSIPTSGILGCVQAVSITACFFMVLADYRRGIKLALFTTAFSIFGNMRGIIATGSMGSFPGIINCVLYSVILIFTYKQLKLSDTQTITDASTGLFNRYGFERELEARIHSQDKGYVVYMHVGGFHDLNANLGRKYGNQILREVARRIVEIVGDKGEVFKIEGAEFAIILSEDCNYEEMVSRVMESIEQSIEVDKNGISVNCYVTACAGIADFFDRKAQADDIMMCTDVAMNCAVNTEGMKMCTYNDALKQQIARTSEVENLIKEGLEHDYFYLQYQPQFVLDGKKLRGFEALVRMRLPDGSIVSPGEFIPVAEKSDLIMDIDRYVRERAMREFKEMCLKSSDLVLSVNVSAKEISSPGFADEILESLDSSGFPAGCLEIEITEYSFAQSVELTINNISRLRDRDIKIAVDDFGTGYTSLSQLLNLPVTLLKIDKSLIDNIEGSEINRDFVKTVIYMGHLMNCEVISEGVEQDSQLRLLNQYDCDFIQGFVWSRPLEHEAAMALCGVV